MEYNWLQLIDLVSSPDHLLGPALHIQLASQDKKVITKTVDVGHDLLVNLSSRLGQTKNLTFGTATNGATHMRVCSTTLPARQDEEAYGWQSILYQVYLLLHFGNHLAGHNVALTHFALTVIGGQVTTHHEEIALHIGEELLVVLVRTVGDEHADV